MGHVVTENVYELYWLETNNILIAFGKVTKTMCNMRCMQYLLINGIYRICCLYVYGLKSMVNVIKLQWTNYARIINVNFWSVCLTALSLFILFIYFI